MGGFPASDSVQFNKPRGSSTEEALHSLQTRCYVRGFINTNPREPQAALRVGAIIVPITEMWTLSHRRSKHSPKGMEPDDRVEEMSGLTETAGVPRERAWHPRGPRFLPGSDPSAPESLRCCCSPLSLQGGYRRSMPPGGGGKSSLAAGSNGASAILDSKMHFSAA